MNAGHLAKTTTEAVRRLVRLNLVAYRMPDSEHLDVTANERTATVELLTGHWSAGNASGKGIFSLARYLDLDMAEVTQAWTKAAGGR